VPTEEGTVMDHDGSGPLGWLGRRAVHAATHATGTLALVGRAAAHLGALRIQPVRRVLVRQIYFSGVQAFDAVAVVAAMVGLLIVTQTAKLTGSSGWVGPVLAWTAVRELGPLLAAMVVLARSSPAIATELASMRLHGEIDALWVMGIDPFVYLVVPRLLGLAIGLAGLTIWFQGMAVAGGAALAALLRPDVTFVETVSAVSAEVGVGDLTLALSKALFFGGAVAAIACYHGYREHHSPTEIPQAATAAVVEGLLCLFLIDALFALPTLS